MVKQRVARNNKLKGSVACHSSIMTRIEAYLPLEITREKQEHQVAFDKYHFIFLLKNYASLLTFFLLFQIYFQDRFKTIILISGKP